MAYDPVRDRGLTMLDASHLFRTNTTRIAVLRGRRPRQFCYDFIGPFAPRPSRRGGEKGLGRGTPAGPTQLEELLGRHSGLGIAENARRHRIDEGEPPVGIGSMDHVAGVVDEVAVPPLGSFNGLRAHADLLVQRPVPRRAANKQQHDHAAANPHGLRPCTPLEWSRRGKLATGPATP